MAGIVALVLVAIDLSIKQPENNIPMWIMLGFICILDLIRIMFTKYGK